MAHSNGIDLEGACEGSLACSTCHLIIEKEFFEKLPEPSDEEEDMLDLAWGLTHTSRLGCQIIVNDSLDGMKVKIPTGTRNSYKMSIKWTDSRDIAILLKKNILKKIMLIFVLLTYVTGLLI